MPPQFHPGQMPFPGAPGVPGLPQGMPGVPGVPGLPQGMVPGMQMMGGGVDPVQQQQLFIAQQQQLAAAQARAMSSATKKKQGKKGPQAPALPRQMAPPGTDHYAKGAMAADSIEPWADALDELDPRELAMSRFRARNEVMAEIFGPERIQTIPTKDADAWAGFGPPGESLEAKVVALEKDNAELEAKFDADIEAFRKRLEEADGGNEAAAAAVVAGSN
ncbi:hypothetical protein CC85DRAFT_293338 [Cutaneotrichosporon oleaginosum]|uniref:Uncharacterized protein n=1 Tax=Cutaneotrichosporon oleaginosum TaxID=879819 RepID=A0A0J0XGS7_9TREE|nr:uncharacterized protein CC85DRAFT_293338 [Cutaneotrichosporon oleaginosum]KLT40268.1 hypothetical protein CC85DRAFT_293338 [Cutaneotrichosporon oleaginosum]TXT11283.1 hypothetical protein COLE_01693 [Cutaneotrichosporon oleaginosum]